MGFQKGNDIGRRTQFKSGTQAAENGSKGGKKSQENRKAAKSVLDNLVLLLEKKYDNGLTGYERQAVALFEKAEAGDVQAMKLLLELRGELKKRIELNSDQPFQVKVIETTEELNSKINDYLNG